MDNVSVSDSHAKQATHGHPHAIKFCCISRIHVYHSISTR